MINKIDSSINRFTKLISIDLSGNNITSITDMILLPKLQRINISNNKYIFSPFNVVYILLLSTQLIFFL